MSVGFMVFPPHCPLYRGIVIMVSEPNANKQVQKKIQLLLQCLEGLPFNCEQFSAMITLKIWQTPALGQEISWRGAGNLANTSTRAKPGEVAWLRIKSGAGIRRQGFAPTYWIGAIPFRQGDLTLPGSALGGA
jgi:hypothetical protein